MNWSANINVVLALLCAVLFSVGACGQEANLNERLDEYKKSFSTDPKMIIEKVKEILKNPEADDTLQARSYQFLGKCYAKIEEWDSSFHYRYKALDQAIKIERRDLEAYARNNVAVMHLMSRDTALAKVELSLMEDYVNEEASLSFKGNYYATLCAITPLDSTDLVNKYTTKSIEIYEELGDSMKLAFNHGALVQNYIVLNKLDSARFHMDLALSYVTKENSSEPKENSGCYYLITLGQSAVLYAAESNFEQAESTFIKAIELSNSIRGCNQLEYFYRQLYKLYTDHQKYAEAIKYLELSHKHALEAKLEQARLRSNSEDFDNLKLTIEDLSKEHEEAVLSLTDLKVKHNLDKQQLEFTRTMFYSVLLFSILALGLIVFLFIQSWRLKTKKKALEVAKTDLERSNKMQSTLVEDIQEKNQELISVNSELSQVKSSLIHSEKMNAIGTLSAGIAHELNNPLNFISGGIDILSNNIDNSGVKLDNEELEKILEMMKDGSQRASSIIKNLRKFSQKGQSESIQSNSVKKIVESASSLLREKFNRQNITYEFKELEEDLNASCNEEAIVLSLVNLLINAAQAVSDLGKICVTASSEEKHVIITVEDNGVGIDKDVINQVFDPFFTTRPADTNSGLGLYLVHTLITASGGKVTVTSEVGKGTQFRIQLLKVFSA